ncbi:MAG: Kelch repeat-containing protein [Chitinophagales bacterium]
MKHPSSHSIGISRRIFLSTLIVFSLSLSFAQTGGTWTSISSMPATGRAAAVAFTIGEVGYVGTGLNFSIAGSALKDFWKYDPSNDAWTQVADFGGGKRSGATAFVVNKLGYVMTGSGTSQKKSDLWQYDPDANSWTQKTSLPADARNYATAFSVGTKGYLGIGYNSSSECLNDFWQYDPVADSWTQKADAPGLPRSSAVGFSIDGKGYLGTGFTVNDVNDFYSYDTLSDSWAELSAVGPTARDGAAAFVLNGHGFICSGVASSVGSNDLLEYDPATDTWTYDTPLPGLAKEEAVAFAIGGIAYFGSGFDDTFNETIDFYSYSPDTAVPTSANFLERHQSILITPDPVIEEATISVETDQGVSDIGAIIFSEDGKQISSSCIVKKTEGDHAVEFIFKRNELPEGVYLVCIKKENHFLASKKMIVQ